MRDLNFKWNLSSLTLAQRETRRRVLEISHKFHLSHIGSCLSSIDLIDEIYNIKKKDEKFILSNGHAGIALYVILEKNGYIKSPHLYKKLHIHPDRNPEIGIDVSTGSLGQGLPIALGMALANSTQNTYCMTSDGEFAEGSAWETLRIASDLKVANFKIILNANGWGAYGAISTYKLFKRLVGFGIDVIPINGHDPKAINEALQKEVKDNLQIIFACTSVEQLPFLKEQDAHYYVMKDDDYLQALDLLLWS